MDALKEELKRQIIEELNLQEITVADIENVFQIDFVAFADFRDIGI